MEAKHNFQISDTTDVCTLCDSELKTVAFTVGELGKKRPGNVFVPTTKVQSYRRKKKKRHFL